MNAGDNNTPRGRGAVTNPANRFLAIDVVPDPEQLEFDEEYLRELRRPPTKYLDDSSRSIISKNDSPDIPFRYSLNPYRGCLHGCSYCYARPTHEYLGLSAGLDFETTIFVKRDAANLFRDWLARPRYVCETVMMSGVTDCYQPVERELQITRSCLNVALESRQPMALVTKNSLVCRDIDVLSELASHGLTRVALSINSLDQSLTRVMEPACSAPASRLETVRRLTAAGIQVHAMVAPVIPGLNDSEIPAILEAVAAAGAKTASYVLVRLPLAVEELFVEWLRRTQPGQAEKVISRLKSAREGQLNQAEFGTRMRGTGVLADQISQLFAVMRRKNGLEARSEALRSDLFRPPRTSRGQRFLF